MLNPQKWQEIRLPVSTREAEAEAEAKVREVHDDPLTSIRQGPARGNQTVGRFEARDFLKPGLKPY